MSLCRQSAQAWRLVWANTETLDAAKLMGETVLRGESTRVRQTQSSADCADRGRPDSARFGAWLSDLLLYLYSAPSLEECLDLCLCSLEQVLDYEVAGIAFVDGDVMAAAAIRGSLSEDGTAPAPLDVKRHPFIAQLDAGPCPVTGTTSEGGEPWLMLGAVDVKGSWLAAPLQVSGKLLAQLTAYRHGEEGFTATEIDYVSALSPHLALALANSRRLLDIQRDKEALLAQGEYLRRLLEAFPLLSANLDPESLMDRVLEQAIVTIPGAQSGLLFVPEGDLLICRTARGYRPELLQGRPMPLSALTSSGYSINQAYRFPHSIPWWHKAPEPFQTELAAARLGHSSGSPASIILPIRLANDFYCVLVLESWDEAISVADATLEIAQLFATQSAVAIANARLYHVVREYATSLESRVGERTAQIMEAKERSEAILRSVADGVVVTDLEGEIIQVNPVAAAWLDYHTDQETRPNLRLRRFVARVSRREGPVSPILIEFPASAQAPGLNCIESGHCAGEGCPAREQGDGLCWMAYPSDHESRDAASAQDHCGECELYGKLEKVSLQAHAAPIAADNGQPIGTVIVLRDISSLRELDRLKSQFVSNVSHELRTPLSNIKLYLSLLRRGRAEKRFHYLDILDEETNRLSQLIEDLLDLSRLENGRAPAMHSPQFWQDIVPQVLETYRPQLESRHLELETSLAADTPAVLADRNQLIQVLTNLVNNALNYTKPNGHIWVQAAPLRDGKQLWAKLLVRDTGVGISEADLQHIFDRFYRGAAEALGIPGSGLGLTIVREIVEMYGGHVDVESELGVGSTFTVYLPASPGPDTNETAAMEPSCA